MYVVCVTVTVAPGQGDAFAAAAKKNHEGSLQEPGCLRFDVLRQATPPEAGQPELFFLYEVYEREDDFRAHQQTAHYHAFRDEVEPLMHEPRKGVRYQSVYYGGK